jgi:hypothetical protein
LKIRIKSDWLDRYRHSAKQIRLLMIGFDVKSVIDIKSGRHNGFLIDRKSSDKQPNIS